MVTIFVTCYNLLIVFKKSMKKNFTLKWRLLVVVVLAHIAVFSAYAQVDPIKFNLTTTATVVNLNEEIELKITARYVSVSPNQAYIFQGANAFKVKMVFPDGFKQTGGSYHDYVRGELSASTPTLSYTVRGKFTEAADGGSFLLLRGNANANSQSDFILVGKVDFTAFAASEEAGQKQTARISAVSQEYIPFMSLADFRAGEADTSSVIYIKEGDRSGIFLWDKSDNSTPDDTVMTLVSAAKRYKRKHEGVINARWFGANEANADNSAAIQAAINKANGGILTLHGGTFFCRNLNMNQHVNTVFQGTATLKLIDSTKNGVNLLNISYSTNVTIRGLTLDGNIDGLNGHPMDGSILLKILYSDHTKVLENVLQNSDYLAVDVIRSPNTMVYGNRISNTDVGVIVWDDSDNSIISNNAISDGTSDGIFVWGAAPEPAKIPTYSRTITVTGNTISNKSIGWGISVRYGEGIAITGNTVTGCKWGIGGDPNGYSESDSSAKSLNISGNIISNCQHGLYTFCWDSVISDNTLVNISDSPIYVSAKYFDNGSKIIPSKRTTVSGNRAYNSGSATTDFITINRCEDCLVENNILANDATAVANLVKVLSVTSTRNVIRNNKASLTQPLMGVDLTTSVDNTVIGEQGKLSGLGAGNIFRDGYSNPSDSAKLVSKVLILPLRGDFFTVSGTGSMDSIATAGQPYGKKITLFFPTSGVTINKLSGSIDIASSSYVASANTTISFVYMGGKKWVETSRKDILSDVSYLNVDVPTGSAGSFRFKSNTVNAWSLVKNTSNDFEVQRYDAAGTYLDRPISINRTSGIVSIPTVSQTMQYTRSADGATITYNVPHGLPYTPIIISVQPLTPNAFGFNALSANATNFQITYPVAPAAGTNNLQYNITFKKP